MAALGHGAGSQNPTRIYGLTCWESLGPLLSPPRVSSADEAAKGVPFLPDKRFAGEVAAFSTRRRVASEPSSSTTPLNFYGLFKSQMLDMSLTLFSLLVLKI